MNAVQPDSDELSALVRDMAELMDSSPLQREVLDAAMRSVASAMLLVPDDERAELQELVAQFTADPGDRDTVTRFGKILRDAKAADQ